MTGSEGFRDKNTELKEGKMAERILEVEHEPGEEVVIRIRLPKFPESARGHLKSARKEGLLALRSFIDAAIERAERAEKSQETKRKKVDVE
jgi:hypothetical protein